MLPASMPITLRRCHNRLFRSAIDRTPLGHAALATRSSSSRQGLHTHLSPLAKSPGLTLQKVQMNFVVIVSAMAFAD